jgi:hypothetical protein
VYIPIEPANLHGNISVHKKIGRDIPIRFIDDLGESQGLQVAQCEFFGFFHRDILSDLEERPSNFLLGELNRALPRADPAH